VTQDLFRRVKEVYLEAVERPAPERAAFLAASCGSDAALRAEVESLLAASAGPGLEGVIREEALRLGDVPAKESTARLPDRIGPYEILGELGRGGMGAVYLGVLRDAGLERRVAVKVVRGELGSDLFRERFQTERRILSGLEHPNIARLYDGGTTPDGLPWFAMELVEGDHLIEWAERAGLRREARLRLFLEVCNAVQYAHQHLVVHRDLKPGNILVGKDGTPKLLDFGLAKLLDVPTEERTATRHRLLTPEYASPEQVRGDRITTASDVYSLGVVLYRLLTGALPYRTKTASSAELERAVVSQAPPSTEPVLGADLDTVLRKALAKEPERRYPTVQEFAEDLRRHLDGRPVLARGDSFSYRAGKFLRRHRLAAAAAIAVFVSLSGGAGVALWQAGRARASEAVARKRFEEVRSLAKTVLFELHDEIAPLPGSTKARATLVSTALRYLDSLSKEAGDDRGLLRELAQAYGRVGDVQGNPYESNLGDTAGSRLSYEKEITILEKLVSSPSPDEGDRRLLSSAYLSYGGLLTAVGDTTAGANLADKAVGIRQDLYAAKPSDRQRAVELAFAYQVRGFSLNATSRYREAVASLRQQAALLETLLVATPADPALRRSLALNSLLLATALRHVGDAAEARDRYEKAIVLQQGLVTGNPEPARLRRELAVTVGDYADFLASRGETAAALDRYRFALEARKALAGADPADQNAQLSLAEAHLDLGQTLLAAGRRNEAAASFLTARRMLESLHGKDPTNALTTRLLAGLYLDLGEVARRSAELSASGEACKLYAASVALFRPLDERKSLSPQSVEAYAGARRALSSCAAGPR
jgi:non-specific serine/threonine protein kinase/serine/threonine-protein kinase